MIYPNGINNSNRGLSYEIFYYVVVVHQSNEDSLIFPVESVSVENDNKDQGISLYQLEGMNQYCLIAIVLIT